MGWYRGNRKYPEKTLDLSDDKPPTKGPSRGTAFSLILLVGIYIICQVRTSERTQCSSACKGSQRLLFGSITNVL